MAFADNIIDMLRRRAAESNLILTEIPQDGEAFPRLEIATDLNDVHRVLFAAPSSAETEAWLDGFEKSRNLAAQAMQVAAEADALAPDAAKNVKTLLLAIAKRIEDHETRLNMHDDWFSWLRQWLNGLGAFIAGNPFAGNPFDEALEEGEDETA